MDLIALVEEYKQHSAHADASLRQHKEHIADLEKDIVKLRAKDGQHFSFVRELEESIRSLDNQLRQSQLAGNKKDDEIKSLKQRLNLAEHDFDQRAAIESRELHYLREEKKRLLLELSLRDHQLTEFEKQIDHQQTSLVNLKVGSGEMIGGKKKKVPPKPQKPETETQLKSSDINLYSIVETSPANSPKGKSRSVLEEVRKELHSDVEVEEETLPVQEQPRLAPALLSTESSYPVNSSSSPRSGKVEMLTDESEFRGELGGLGGTIFSNFSSPERAATIAGRKWASPRDEDKEEGEGGNSPVPVKMSPSKPPKPQRPQKIVIPAPASPRRDEIPVSASASLEQRSRKAAEAAGTRELDSGLGLHHMLKRQVREENRGLGSVLDNAGERERERMKSATPDTLSPPSSPEGRARDERFRSMEEAVSIRRSARTKKPPMEENKEGDGEEVTQPAVTARGGRASERRLKTRETLASIKAIVNKSRANRKEGDDAPLPGDMTFERA